MQDQNGAALAPGMVRPLMTRRCQCCFVWGLGFHQHHRVPRLDRVANADLGAGCGDRTRFDGLEGRGLNHQASPCEYCPPFCSEAWAGYPAIATAYAAAFA